MPKMSVIKISHNSFNAFFFEGGATPVIGEVPGPVVEPSPLETMLKLDPHATWELLNAIFGEQMKHQNNAR